MTKEENIKNTGLFLLVIVVMVIAVVLAGCL